MALIKAFRNSTEKEGRGKDAPVIHEGDDQFYTEPRGKGEPVHSVKSAGGGKYYVYKRNEGDAEPVMTDAEVKKVGGEWFRNIMADRIVDGKVRHGRVHKALDALASIRKAAKTGKMGKGGAPWTEDQAEMILKRLMDEVGRIEQELLATDTAEEQEVFTLD